MIKNVVTWISTMLSANKQLIYLSRLTWRCVVFLWSIRTWKVCGKVLKMFQAQVCTTVCTERVHWTINNDINVWQIKWLVNNLLTALTSEPLSGIDQPAVPGFVWQDGSFWSLLGRMERGTKKKLFWFSSSASQDWNLSWIFLCLWHLK